MPPVEFVPHTLPHFLKDEGGGSLIEYVLVGSIIVTLCILVLLAVGKGS
jgi:Flp pilus assembly pilin Flp